MLYNHFMIKEKLEEYLQIEGFFPLSSNIEEITAMVKIENNFLNVLQIIDYTKELYLDFEQYNEIKRSITETFQSRGIPHVHILSLFLKEDMSMGQAVIKEDPLCWEFDLHQMKLHIGEGKQPDFYGMKGLIQTFIDGYNSEDGSFKTLDESSEVDSSNSEEDSSAFTGEANNIKNSTIKKENVFWTYLRNAPIVTLILVIINVLVAFATVHNPDFFYQNGSLIFYEVYKGEWYRLITSMFLHGGADHLFNNMLLLYFIGDILERKLGWMKYLSLYFLTGILANVTSCAVELITNEFHISYGASGAVYGLIGMLLYMVLRKVPGIKISKLSMLIMVAFSIYSSFTEKNINIAAHIGGLISGFLLMFLFCPMRKRRKKSER